MTALENVQKRLTALAGEMVLPPMKSCDTAVQRRGSRLCEMGVDIYVTRVALDTRAKRGLTSPLCVKNQVLLLECRLRAICDTSGWCACAVITFLLGAFSLVSEDHQ